MTSTVKLVTGQELPVNGYQAVPDPLLFIHFKIFGDNLPNTFFFHVQLTSDHSVNRILLQLLALPAWHWLDPTCWRSLSIGVIFPHLVTLFETLEHLKKTSVWHSVIFIHLLIHLTYLWLSFPWHDSNFQVYALHSAERSENKVLTKVLGITHLFPHNELVYLPYIAVATNTRAE